MEKPNPNRVRARALTANKRRTQAAALYAQGFVQDAIANRLGISQVAVSKMLKHIRAEWKEERLTDLDATIQRELARIDDVELNAWEGWQKSTGNAESAKMGDSGFDITVRGQSGNPKFLDVVLKCIERRCKLLGLDEPQKFVFTGEIRVLADDDWYNNQEQVKLVENTAS